MRRLYWVGCIQIDEHGDPPTDGRPYRLPDESDEACLARYGIDPTRQLCIFLNLTDASGKEVSRQLLMDGESLTAAPAGGKLKKAPVSRIFANAEFGYRTITVERPLRDAAGKIVRGEKGKLKGKPQPDSSLRDTENVPLSEDVEAYFKREVPHRRVPRQKHSRTAMTFVPATGVRANRSAGIGSETLGYSFIRVHPRIMGGDFAEGKGGC